MFFRFFIGIVLAVCVSQAGIHLENQNRRLQNAISKQHYKLDVLMEHHAHLRLKTQQMSAPARLYQMIDNGELKVQAPKEPEKSSSRKLPLLRWQKPAEIR